MKDIEIEKIITDMMAAGCSQADADRVRSMHEAGMDAEIIQCLKKCRCDRMDELHDKQRSVDRLDRLIRSADSITSAR